MRIWVFNHYASTPDQPTTGAYFLLKALADKGSDVTVFASGFNYYRRRELRLGAHPFTRAERDGNLTFQWIRTTPTSGRALSRMVNMLTYTFVALMVALFKRGKPDIVVGVCPHPFAAFAAWLISVLRGGKFVYEIRDIWPESLTEGKLISPDHPFAKFMGALQKFLYRRAYKILSVLPAVDTYLREIGIDDKKFVWIPNGVNINPAELHEPKTNDASVFTAMYIGGHSKYHAIDDLLDAANILQEKGVDDVRFVLIGDGSEKTRLMQRARAMNLKHLEFRDAVPRTDIPKVVDEASCFVICSRSMPIHRYGISPNKLCDAMLAGKPIIMALPAANDLVTQTGAGFSIAPQQPQLLAESILKMRAVPAAERAEMGRRGRQYAIANFDAGNLADKFLKQVAA